VEGLKKGYWTIVAGRWLEVERIGVGRGTTWIWADGVAYPISECQPLPEGEIYPELLDALIYDLGQVQTLEQLTAITGTLFDSQKRTIWEGCPSSLRQRLTELKRAQEAA
jgi:hypothetical protein